MHGGERPGHVEADCQHPRLGESTGGKDLVQGPPLEVGAHEERAPVDLAGGVDLGYPGVVHGAQQGGLARSVSAPENAVAGVRHAAHLDGDLMAPACRPL